MLDQIITANVDIDEMDNHIAILMLLEEVGLFLNYWNIVNMFQKAKANTCFILIGSCHALFPLSPSCLK